MMLRVQKSPVGKYTGKSDYLSASFQLLSRDFSFRHDGGEGGRWKRKEREGAGKHALLIKLQARRNGFPRPQVSVCRIHKGETKRLRRREPKNSVKRVHFGTHRSRVSVHASHDAFPLRSPVAHPGSPCSQGASV